jgi:hypothetical protein
LAPEFPFGGQVVKSDWQLDWAIAWLIPTIQGGTHVSGFRTGLVEALREFCEFRDLLPRGIRLTPDDVCSTLNGRYQINVAFTDRFTAINQPCYRPIKLPIAFHDLSTKRKFRGQINPTQFAQQVIRDTVLVTPSFIVLGLTFILKSNLKARAQHSFGPQKTL